MVPFCGSKASVKPAHILEACHYSIPVHPWTCTVLPGRRPSVKVLSVQLVTSVCTDLRFYDS